MAYIPRIKETREAYVKGLNRPQLVGAYLQLIEAYVELEAKYDRTLEAQLLSIEKRLDELIHDV